MKYPTEKFNKVSKWFEKYSNSFSKDNNIDTNECKSEAERILSNSGYTEKCPGGTYRTVYANNSNDTVLKIALGQKGVRENAAEIRNNTRMSKAEIPDVIDEGYCKGLKYIADIFEYEVGSNRWIVMEKAEVTPDNVSNEMADEIQDAFALSGIHIDEISPINMGRINGIPVVFDYGGT